MFINWNQRELHIKLVYYGPPLSGKTTNLEKLHEQVPKPKRSDLVSVKTSEERTLFFDFMEVSLNEIKGLRPKFKIYT
ncbi:MAG: gliding-motility protein MglA, partial [Bacteroidota bacterium]